MKLAYFYMAAFGISFVSLVMFFECLLIVKRESSIGIKKTLLASLVLPFILVIPTLLFSTHPWGKSIGLFAYVLFLAPPSLVAGLVVGFLYGFKNGPIIGKAGTMILLAISLAGAIVWYARSKAPQITANQSQPIVSQKHRESDDHMGNVRKSLDQYAKMGLIKEYRTEGDVNVILIDGAQWKSKSQEYNKAIFMQIIRSYESLGYSLNITLKDYNTNSVYGEYHPPSKLTIY